jgi:hypothetical protein
VQYVAGTSMRDMLPLLLFTLLGALGRTGSLVHLVCLAARAVKVEASYKEARVKERKHRQG